MTYSLEDQSMTQPASNANATQGALLDQVLGLDARGLVNRGLYSWVLLYIYYMGGIDDMLFRGNEGDGEAAAKTTGLFLVTNELGTALRKMWPQLQI